MNQAERVHERALRLEALVKALVREVNVYNQPDCLDGYHNGLGDTWVAEGDSTTLNQELEALGLEQLEDVVSKDEDDLLANVHPDSYTYSKYSKQD